MNDNETEEAWVVPRLSPAVVLDLMAITFVYKAATSALWLVEMILRATPYVLAALFLRWAL